MFSVYIYLVLVIAEWQFSYSCHKIYPKLFKFQALGMVLFFDTVSEMQRLIRLTQVTKLNKALTICTRSNTSYLSGNFHWYIRFRIFWSFYFHVLSQTVLLTPYVSCFLAFKCVKKVWIIDPVADVCVFFALHILVLRKHHYKLCVSVPLTGVVFRFEQPVYSILESGFFQEVCVMLVMGSLDRQVLVTVQTGTTGTATGMK